MTYLRYIYLYYSLSSLSSLLLSNHSSLLNHLIYHCYLTACKLYYFLLHLIFLLLISLFFPIFHYSASKFHYFLLHLIFLLLISLFFPIFYYSASKFHYFSLYLIFLLLNFIIFSYISLFCL